jgi:hypothetical protein
MIGSTIEAVLANRAGIMDDKGVNLSEFPEMPSSATTAYGVHEIVHEMIKKNAILVNFISSDVEVVVVETGLSKDDIGFSVDTDKTDREFILEFDGEFPFPKHLDDTERLMLFVLC